MSARSLSLILLALTVLVTMVDSGPRAGPLVSNGSTYVNCYGTGASDTFECPQHKRRAIASGNLSGSSF